MPTCSNCHCINVLILKHACTHVLILHAHFIRTHVFARLCLCRVAMPVSVSVGILFACALKCIYGSIFQNPSINRERESACDRKSECEREKARERRRAREREREIKGESEREKGRERERDRHTYTHTHTHTYTRKYHAHTQTHARTHTCTHAHAHAYTLSLTHTRLNRYMYTFMYTYDKFCMDWMRGGGLGSRPIFKKFNEPYAPS